MRSHFHDSNDTGYGTAFRDVLFAMFGVLAALVVILILLPKMPEEAKDAQDRSRGNIRVEAIWPDDMNVDIDLWGKAPGMPAVGYSNKTGVVLSLIRDDLGNYADISGRNFEVMFSYGLPSGEWVFNLHWFGKGGANQRVPVDVIITLTYDDSANSKERPTQLVATQVIMTSVGQETTIIRFKLDADGKLLPESQTSLFKAIRSPTGP